jgi:WD40 repeat protein
VVISPSGGEIVVGNMEGQVLVFDTRTFAKKLELNLRAQSKQLHLQHSAVDGSSNHTLRTPGNTGHQHWISTMQFSPSGHALAVGTHGCVVVLLDVTDGYRVRAVLDRSSSPITALDWSADGTLLQVNDQSLQLLHYHVDDQDLKAVTAVTNASSVRDVQWHSHTCALSWPTAGAVQQLRPDGLPGDPVESSQVNSVDASPSRTLLVSGDDHGEVRLFRFPALPGAQPLSYAGHSAYVTAAQPTNAG